jgi:hypothetical protein
MLSLQHHCAASTVVCGGSTASTPPCGVKLSDILSFTFAHCAALAFHLCRACICSLSRCRQPCVSVDVCVVHALLGTAAGVIAVFSRSSHLPG